VLNNYLDACAVVINDKKNHATAGMVKSLANLVFDLDNDLRAVIKGELKIAGSRKLTISVKEARVAGKVSGTRIPLSMFVQGLEAMDGKRATDLLNEASVLNCHDTDGSKRDVDCPDAFHKEADSVLVNGNVTLVDMKDVQLHGNIDRPLQNDGLHEAVLSRLAGAEPSALRTYLQLALEFLRDHESDIVWTSDAAPELHGLHHSSLEEVEEVSIDKTKIRFGGHFAYRGPFCLDGLGKRITNAINAAASGIARAKVNEQAKEQCLEQAGADHERRKAQAAAAAAKEKKRCMAETEGPNDNVFATADRRPRVQGVGVGALKKL
jgi:hypothetical protein